MGLVEADGNPVIDPYAGKKTVQQGASTSVWCAVSPLLDGLGGVYCLDNNIAVVAEPDPHTLDPRRHGSSGVPAPAGLAPHAADPEAATHLWALSEHLTATKLP